MEAFRRYIINCFWTKRKAIEIRIHAAISREKTDLRYFPTEVPMWDSLQVLADDESDQRVRAVSMAKRDQARCAIPHERVEDRAGHHRSRTVPPHGSSMARHLAPRYVRVLAAIRSRLRGWRRRRPFRPQNHSLPAPSRPACRERCPAWSPTLAARQADRSLANSTAHIMC